MSLAPTWTAIPWRPPICLRPKFLRPMAFCCRWPEKLAKANPRGPKPMPQLSQKDVDSILNPKPACPAARKAR